VHTSNFRILGFTESVSLQDLVALGRERGLPVIEDLGSGCFFDLEKLGIHDEPTVMNSVKAGVDIISFSGDKLLGGPQAGIILCKKEWIAKLKKHPLTRAMRVDKMTLAALEATLRSYESGAEQEIPVVAMLSAEQEILRPKAERLLAMLRDAGIEGEILPTEGYLGGGSVPNQSLPSWAVAFGGGVNDLEEKLRKGATPIIGRIHEGKYLLDVRTLLDSDFETIVQAVREALA
jgi:L-seryl-tRNA(Ser) seleniumtransferase